VAKGLRKQPIVFEDLLHTFQVADAIGIDTTRKRILLSMDRAEKVEQAVAKAKL